MSTDIWRELGVARSFAQWKYKRYGDPSVVARHSVLTTQIAGANKSGTFEKSLDKWAESVSDWGFYAERREKGRAWIHQKRKHLR